MTHTSGPWIVTKGSLSFSALLIRSSREDKCIADCDFQQGDEGRANANLISAAPDLLKALKTCQLQLLQSNNDSEYAQEANDLAIAAIAKAEGRP